MIRKWLVISMVWILGIGIIPSYSHAETPHQFIVINKKLNELAFFENGKLVKIYPVATGKTRSLTPEGTFYIREKIKNRPYYKEKIKGGDLKNPLGDRWLGLSYDYRGTYPIAIHGNNNESSIGKYVSAGCIRMKNKDVRGLYEQVKTKTTVRIVYSQMTFQQIADRYYAHTSRVKPTIKHLLRYQ